MKHTLILNCTYWIEIDLFVYLLFFFYFLHEYISPVGQGDPEYLRHLEQCLAYGKCEIYMWSLSEWLNKWMACAKNPQIYW